MADDIRGDILASLLPSSFGGVPMLHESCSTIGGRRATERPILHSKQQVVADVGPKIRVYNFRGFIAARESVDADGNPVVDRSYQEHRRALLGAFESETPQTFVHAIEGAITGAVAKNFAVDESQNEWGLGRVTCEIVVDTRKATPTEVVGVGSAVVAAAGKTRETFFESLAGRWKVDPSVVGAFEDGLTKAKAAFQSMQEIANQVETLTDGLDAVASTVAEGVAAAASIITLPNRLATDIQASLDVLSSAFPTALAAFEGMLLGFNFGDLDLSIDLTAPSARIRKANNDAMNSAMNGAYLAEAYGFATGIEFTTLDEIDRVESRLDAQWAKIVDAGTSTAEALDSLETLRATFASYLDRARLSAKKLVQDDFAPTTPRTLAFALYGDDALTRTLAGLNGATAYEVVSGRLTVLSS